jgi:hypothetical protein
MCFDHDARKRINRAARRQCQHERDRPRRKGLRPRARKTRKHR